MSNLLNCVSERLLQTPNERLLLSLLADRPGPRTAQTGSKLEILEKSTKTHKSPPKFNMFSRTFRYFKLIYIVAGILMSNEEICESVDQISIAPHVEVKEMLRPRRVYQSVEKVSRSWLRRIDLFGSIKRRLEPLWNAFSIWTIPNYLVDCSTSYISKTFIINSDCDMIYNK